MEKPGEWAPGKAVMRGSALIFALDESGGEESHVGRMLHILVRPATDSIVALD